jgi:hypothetical protein
MPVELVVACVIFVITVLTTKVGLEDAVPAEHGGSVTVIVPVAFTLPQPPVKGMV